MHCNATYSNLPRARSFYIVTQPLGLPLYLIVPQMLNKNKMLFAVLAVNNRT